MFPTRIACIGRPGVCQAWCRRDPSPAFAGDL